MRILFLQGYDGGSHHAFLCGWMKHTKYEMVALSLSGRSWKWRMRHGAASFAQWLRSRVEDDTWGKIDREQMTRVSIASNREIDESDIDVTWLRGVDVVMATSMVDLATFAGLMPSVLIGAKFYLYMHENQFTYPVRQEDTRDIHFGLTQINSVLTAIGRGGKVIFNTDYNRQSMLNGFATAERKLPGKELQFAEEVIAKRSEVIGVGIDTTGLRKKAQKYREFQGNHPTLRIVWAGRWEHDKQPELLADALKRLDEIGTDFELSVIGERFKDEPCVFAAIKQQHGDRIKYWGYQTSREAYEDALCQADVMISTAGHEFQGLSVLEGAAAGCALVLPKALAYPEVFAHEPNKVSWYLENDVEAIVIQLCRLAEMKTQGHVLPKVVESAMRYDWLRIAKQLDERVGI
ncbi:tRNA-queuosine alpha-mannosyltransferase domain-containing protein [Poriferisphaera sp. WC338]|uniref:tRNA-queuosine alpha-mannosyltransferase domain-containing protein n=1 Tax=Poriferisphaera sp. WC338 TaxID=3425129 RepID=UPI003D819925